MGTCNVEVFATVKHFQILRHHDPWDPDITCVNGLWTRFSHSRGDKYVIGNSRPYETLHVCTLYLALRSYFMA